MRAPMAPGRRRDCRLPAGRLLMLCLVSRLCPSSPPCFPPASQTVCTATMTVAGGQLVAKPDAPIAGAACPAGSYAVADQYCLPWCALLLACCGGSTAKQRRLRCSGLFPGC